VRVREWKGGGREWRVAAPIRDCGSANGGGRRSRRGLGLEHPGTVQHMAKEQSHFVLTCDDV